MTTYTASQTPQTITHADMQESMQLSQSGTSHGEEEKARIIPRARNVKGKIHSVFSTTSDDVLEAGILLLVGAVVGRRGVGASFDDLELL